MGRCGVVGSDWIDSVALAVSCGWNRVESESGSAPVILSLREIFCVRRKRHSPVVFAVTFISLQHIYFF